MLSKSSEKIFHLICLYVIGLTPFAT